MRSILQFMKKKLEQNAFLGFVICVSLLFTQIASAQIPASLSGVYVYQDTSCTTADIEGYVEGTFNPPLTLKYQIGTGLVRSVPVSTSSAGASGKTVFTATMTNLSVGSTYYYWMLGSAVGDTPIRSSGTSTFTFDPTMSGCGGTGTARISGLSVIPGSDDASATITGSITNGGYDDKTIEISYRQKVFGVGPVVDFDTKKIDITSLGGKGGVDAFKVVLTGLKAVDYEYRIGDSKKPIFYDGSGTFTVGGGPTGTNKASITKVVPSETSVEIYGTIVGKFELPYINYAKSSADLLSPTRRSIVETKITDTGNDFIFNTTKLEAGTTYYFQVVSEFNKPFSSVGSFKTTGGVAEVKEDQTKFTPGLITLKYKPNILATWGESNITQTKATIFGKMINLKVVPVVQIVRMGGEIVLEYTPDILKDGRFSDVITDLDPDTSYAVFIVDSKDKSVVFNKFNTFITRQIIASPSVTGIGNDNAIISVRGTDGIGGLEVMYSTDAIGVENFSTATMIKTWGWNYEAKLDGLTPDTEYFFRIKIRSYDSDGTITYSDLGTFRTGKGSMVNQESNGERVIPYIVGSAESRDTPLFDGGIVPCSGVDETGKIPTCTFDKLMKLVNNIISLMLFLIAPGLAALMFLYGGFLILTSGGNTEKVGHAKKIFMMAITGILIAFCAWIIVKSILVGLGYNTSFYPTFY